MTVQEIVDQMRAYSATWRAQGRAQVPVAWVDYWARELELAGAYTALPPLGPAYPYWSPFDTFFVSPQLNVRRTLTVGPVTWTRVQ